MADDDPRREPEALRRRVASMEQTLEGLRAALRDANARFHSTVERSMDGVIVLSEEGTVRFANARAGEIFGRPHPDLLGTEFGFPVVAGERSEIDVHRPDGVELVAEMRATPSTWDDGEPAVLVLVRDVTALREAEQRERDLVREQAARREAEAAARRAAILDRAGHLVASTLDMDDLLVGLAELLVDEIGSACVIDVEDDAAHLKRVVVARRGGAQPLVMRPGGRGRIGLSLTMAQARSFVSERSELVHLVDGVMPDVSPEVRDRAMLFDGMKPKAAVVVEVSSGGVRWGSVLVVADDTVPPLDGATRHLVDELLRRTCMGIENARLYRLARESSRAKSDFLAVVSHELRTPLAATIGYAGLMMEGIGGELSEQHQEFVASIRKSSEHLERLIDQIITFARLEGGHEEVDLGDVDPARLVEDCATLIRPMAERRGLEVDVDVEDGGALMRTDERKLSQILLNLATNAVKYTPAGTVRLQCRVTDEEVVFQVHDTGRGIDGDRLQEIFEPFRQLDDPHTRSEEGAGIGLSVVRDLTQLLGGRVEVISEPGQGSTFSVTLPREGPEQPEAAETTGDERTA